MRLTDDIYQELEAIRQRLIKAITENYNTPINFENGPTLTSTQRYTIMALVNHNEIDGPFLVLKRSTGEQIPIRLQDTRLAIQDLCWIAGQMGL